MKSNPHRRCGTCKYRIWGTSDISMIPKEDRHTIPGICRHDSVPRGRDMERMHYHGKQCKHWESEDNKSLWV